MTTVVEPPEARVSRGQVTFIWKNTGTPPSQAPEAGVTLTRVTPRGSTSSRTTFVAVEGPVLTTSSSYRKFVPAFTGSGPARPLAFPVHKGAPGLSALQTSRAETSRTA